MDLYTIGCTIEPPIVWYIQKCMLIWIICFYFSFVYAICSSKMKTRHVKRDRITEKVLLRLDNFQLARNMARLHFWRTDHEDKTEIKTNYPYQHTLLIKPNERGLSCASDGVKIHIGGMDSLNWHTKSLSKWKARKKYGRRRWMMRF